MGGRQVRRDGGVIETSPWGVVNMEQGSVKKKGGHAIRRYPKRPNPKDVDESLTLVAW